MRIVAWNCCAGPLETKLAAVRPLRADLVVLPEAPRLSESPQHAWIGENPRKGLGVVARPPWRLEPLGGVAPLPRYFLPLRVVGPDVSFALFAVWAHNFGRDRYVRATHRALDLWHEGIVRDAPLLAGDFNSHSQWDHQHPDHLSHTALVRRLTDLGYVSAYHEARGKEHGAEGHATFYEYRHRHRPYHIDYVFVPDHLRAHLAHVAVGQHRKWARWSDHMPLTVDFDAAPSGRSSGRPTSEMRRA